MSPRVALCALALFTLGACSKSEEHKEGTAPSAAASTPAVASAKPVPAGSAATTATAGALQAADPLPNERKADRKAAKEVTAANYKDELSRMEKEIGNP